MPKGWQVRRSLSRVVDPLVDFYTRIRLYWRKGQLEEQRAYRWELHEQSHGHHDEETATFDFLGGASVDGLLKLLVFVVILGGLIGAAATLFFYMEYALHLYFVHLDEIVSEDLSGYTYVHWLVGTTLSGGFVGYITHVYLPECAGAGIDSTKICIAVSAPIPFRIVIFRMVLTSAYLAFGHPLGIETSTLHISAAIASIMLRVASKVLPVDFRLGHLPTWVLVGMVTGLASAFEAPLAGIIYAFEEYMNVRKIGLSVVLIGVASTVGVFLSHAVRSYLDDKFDMNTRGRGILRVEFEIGHASLLSILMAFLCALISHILATITLRIRLFNSTVLSKYVFPRFHGFVGGFCVGVIGMIAYAAVGTKEVWGLGWSTYRDVLTYPLCTERDADYARLMVISESETGEQIYFLRHRDRLNDTPRVYTVSNDENKCISLSFLTIFIVGKVLTVAIAISVNGPGGLLFPALVIGAAFGGVVGGLFQMVDPDRILEYHTLILLGMVGLFSSVMRTPLTAILVAYEMSGYGAIGLSVGLTYSTIMTAVLAHLLADAMESHDLVTLMMLQDGIDVADLFKKGAKFLDQEEVEDAKPEVPVNPNAIARRRSSAATFNNKTVVLRRRGEGADENISRRPSISAKRRHSQPDRISVHSSNSDSSDELDRGGAAMEDISMGATKDVKKIQKSTAHTTLLNAAKSAQVHQHLADNVWLHQLAEHSNVRGMHEHIKKTPDIELDWVPPRGGSTLLSRCIKNRLENGVRLLLYKRCNPENRISTSEMRPLAMACMQGLSQASASLIAYGANMASIDATTGNSVLHFASASGNTHLVRELIRFNASLNLQNKARETPLLVASRHHHRNLACILASESWGHQSSDATKDFSAKYVLKSSTIRPMENTANGIIATSTGDKKKSVNRHLDLVQVFRNFVPANSSWGVETNRMRSESLEDFERELTVGKVPFQTIQEMPSKFLFNLHIKLCAQFYLTGNHLYRHTVVSEVRLLVSHNHREYVLMEKHGCNLRYMNMIIPIPESHLWHECAVQTVCLNLGVLLSWIQENLKLVGHEDFEEEVYQSKCLQFQTTFHVSSVTFRIIDKSSTGCIDDVFIGLPALEPFTRDGKIWAWNAYDDSEHKFDWGKL